jgi:hypothetical protein
VRKFYANFELFVLFLPLSIPVLEYRYILWFIPKNMVAKNESCCSCPDAFVRAAMNDDVPWNDVPE